MSDTITTPLVTIESAVQRRARDHALDDIEGPFEHGLHDLSRSVGGKEDLVDFAQG